MGLEKLIKSRKKEQIKALNSIIKTSSDTIRTQQSLIGFLLLIVVALALTLKRQRK